MTAQRVVLLSMFFLGAFSATVTAIAGTDKDDAEIKAIIAAIEQGWENADGTPFYEHFLGQDGARFFESGGQNEGLRDLVEHHVEPEGETLDGLDLEFSNIETHVESEFAWALADVEVRATIRADGRQIQRRGHETFLFRRTPDGWKVIHTHSSTRAVR